MQEYRVSLETMPGLVRTADAHERLMEKLEATATEFLNYFVLVKNEETDAVTLEAWLDSPSPLVALGTTVNIFERSIRHTLSEVPALWFFQSEIEMTDFMAAQTPWPVLDSEPHIEFTPREKESV